MPTYVITQCYINTVPQQIKAADADILRQVLQSYADAKHNHRAIGPLRMSSNMAGRLDFHFTRVGKPSNRVLRFCTARVEKKEYKALDDELLAALLMADAKD